MAEAIILVDTFCFNGEEIVKLRLQYLEPWVDMFVIVEAWETHSGNKKSILYSEHCKDWFIPYKNKIKWVIIERFPEMTDHWFKNNEHQSWMLDNQKHWYRESYQRDLASSYILESFRGRRLLVLVADVDEIPRDHYVQKQELETLYSYNEPIFLEMDFFYYNFNWKKQYKWYKAFLLPDTLLKTSSYSFSSYRTNFTPRLMIRDAGWHLSYFMCLDDLIRKLGSFAHRECDKDVDIEYVEQCFKYGFDLFKRGTLENCIASDDVLPSSFKAIQ